MAVKVALVKDPIRKNGHLIPRRVQRSRIDFDKLINFMDKGTGLSESDIRSVFLQFIEALVFYLPDGSDVQTPMGVFRLNIKSRTLSNSLSESPQNRKITSNDMALRILADNSLLERIRLKASISMVDTPVLLSPSITRIENMDLGAAVNTASAGQILHIVGSRLSFDKSDQEQGVFLVDSSGATTTARIAVYSRIGTNFIDGKLPALAAGNYKLEVRTRPTEKDIRVGAHGGVIVIA